MNKSNFNVDCLKKLMIAGSISISLPFLFISNSFGDVYGPNPVTLKGYSGSKTDSTAYTGQIARQLLHNSLKKIVSTGNPNDFNCYDMSLWPSRPSEKNFRDLAINFLILLM